MMRGWCCSLLLLSLLLAAAAGRATDGLPEGWWNAIAAIDPLADAGTRVAAISDRFLGIPYRAGTLGGGPGRHEELVASLSAVDCFTLLDYVEALRRSDNPAEFRSRLVEVRYRDGDIAWARRRHFFTDWVTAPGGRIADVTAEIGGSRTRLETKRLNMRADGTLYLPEVAVQERVVRYLPAAALDGPIFGRLQTGDYLGIYTAEPGLDVSHVGIVLRRAGKLYLRHASSRAGMAKVIDSDLRRYLAGTPGVVVLRPR